MSPPDPIDQAQRLRELATNAEGTSDGRLPALAVTGGKGGVGKTCVAVNLAIELADAGLRPLLVDCDLGLANADVLLGLKPTTTLFDVVFDRAAIGSAVMRHSAGIDFIPAASGREELTALSRRQFSNFIGELRRVARGYDLLVLDTAAGIHHEVTALLRAATAGLVVLTPDPTSLTDAYALIKVLEQQEPGCDLRILVNQVRDQQEALRVFGKIRKVATTYLGRELTFVGHLPRDRAVQDAVRARRPFVRAGPSPAKAALTAVAARLRGVDWTLGARELR